MDEPDLARVARQHLVHHALGPVAVGALVVRELDDRDRGADAGPVAGAPAGTATLACGGTSSRIATCARGAQLLLVGGPPLGLRALGRAPRGSRAIAWLGRLAAEAVLVLLVDGLRPGAAGSGGDLRVHLLLQQRLGREPRALRLGRDQPLGDQLVERLPADLVLLLPQLATAGCAACWSSSATRIGAPFTSATTPTSRDRGRRRGGGAPARLPDGPGEPLRPRARR